MFAKESVQTNPKLSHIKNTNQSLRNLPKVHGRLHSAAMTMKRKSSTHPYWKKHQALRGIHSQKHQFKPVFCNRKQLTHLHNGLLMMRRH